MPLERSSKKNRQGLQAYVNGEVQQAVNANASLIDPQNKREQTLAKSFRIDIAATEGMARKRRFADQKLLDTGQHAVSEYQQTRDDIDAIADRPMSRDARADVGEYASDMLTLMEAATKDGYARSAKVINEIAARDLTPPVEAEVTYRTRQLSARERIAGKVTEKA